MPIALMLKMMAAVKAMAEVKKWSRCSMLFRLIDWPSSMKRTAAPT
jgi:hypothetical protein